MTSFYLQLQSAVAQLVEVNVPERICLVMANTHWYDKHGSHDLEEVWAVGDRQVCQREFENAVKASSCCKLSRGARTKGFVQGSVDHGSNGCSETFRIKEISRSEFIGMIFNPALADLRMVVADLTATKE